MCHSRYGASLWLADQVNMCVVKAGSGRRVSFAAGPDLPAIASRGVAGAPGSAVDFRSHRPLRTRPTDQRKAAAQRVSRGGAGGIGTRSGLDAGGPLRTIRTSHARSTNARMTGLPGSVVSCNGCLNSFGYMMVHTEIGLLYPAYH
jgi:hypothetical protein